MLEFTCFTPALLGSPLVTCQFQTQPLSMALANPYKSYPAFWQESTLDCLTLYFLNLSEILIFNYTEYMDTLWVQNPNITDKLTPPFTATHSPLCMLVIFQTFFYVSTGIGRYSCKTQPLPWVAKKNHLYLEYSFILVLIA